MMNTTNNPILDHDNSNIIGYTLNPNREKEETFQQINRDYDIKKKKVVIICILIESEIAGFTTLYQCPAHSIE